MVFQVRISGLCRKDVAKNGRQRTKAFLLSPAYHCWLRLFGVAQTIGNDKETRLLPSRPWLNQTKIPTVKPSVMWSISSVIDFMKSVKPKEKNASNGDDTINFTTNILDNGSKNGKKRKIDVKNKNIGDTTEIGADTVKDMTTGREEGAKKAKKLMLRFHITNTGRCEDNGCGTEVGDDTEAIDHNFGNEKIEKKIKEMKKLKLKRMVMAWM
jgi:hypothetical protein